MLLFVTALLLLSVGSMASQEKRGPSDDGSQEEKIKKDHPSQIFHELKLQEGPPPLSGRVVEKLKSPSELMSQLDKILPFPKHRQEENGGKLNLVASKSRPFFPSLRDLLNIPMEGGLRVRFAAPLVVRKRVGSDEPGLMKWAPFGQVNVPLGDKDKKKENENDLKGDDSSSEEEKGSNKDDEEEKESSEVPLSHMNAVVPRLNFYKETMKGEYNWGCIMIAANVVLIDLVVLAIAFRRALNYCRSRQACVKSYKPDRMEEEVPRQHVDEEETERKKSPISNV